MTQMQCGNNYHIKRFTKCLWCEVTLDDFLTDSNVSPPVVAESNSSNREMNTVIVRTLISVIC